MKPICKNCQYWRQQSWCSNSKSPAFRAGNTLASESCSAFTPRGQKAPLSLRIFNKLLRRLK